MFTRVVCHFGITWNKFFSRESLTPAV